MSYAVQADLLLRITAAELVALTDDGKTGQVNAATVQGALDEATGMIDSYCRSRYTTPLQTSNDATRICRDITVYLLYSRRPQKMSETVQARYQDAMKHLQDISTGKASFDQPVNAPSAQSPSSGVALPTTDNSRFNDCNLQGFS